MLVFLGAAGLGAALDVVAFFVVEAGFFSLVGRPFEAGEEGLEAAGAGAAAATSAEDMIEMSDEEGRKRGGAWKGGDGGCSNAFK